MQPGERVVTVSWVAKRWNTGRDTITRLLQNGDLRGFRITRRGWWRIIEKSVFEYERSLRNEYALSESGQTGGEQA